MKSLWLTFLQPQICFMCGGGGEDTGGGGDDNNSSTTTTQSTGKFESSRQDLEDAGYKVSDDGNAVYSESGQVAGANWSGSSTVNNIVDDNESKGQQSTSQTIKSGDTVSQLALDNNTTIEQIKKDNPNIDINNIKAGEKINITANTKKDNESIYTGATQGELDAGNIMKVASTEEIMSEYEKKLQADDDMNALDQIAAENEPKKFDNARDASINSNIGDTVEVNGKLYVKSASDDPNVNSKLVAVKDTNTAAIQDDYSPTVADPVSTSEVDYSTTSSGEDYEIATMMDDADISGGVAVEPEPAYDVDRATAVEEILVRDHGWTDNGDGTFTSSGGSVLARDPNDPDGKFVAADSLKPEVTPVEVNTFSDNEYTTPAAELPKYDDTILETGTGGLENLVTSTKTDATQDGTIVEERPGIDVSQMTDDELSQVGSGPSGFIDDGVGQVGVVNPSAGGSVPIGSGPAVINPGAGDGKALVSIPKDMHDYIDTLISQTGTFTFDDLEAAGFSPEVIREYDKKVGDVPGFPAEDTMLYRTLFPEDQAEFVVVNPSAGTSMLPADTTEVLDYEDYITQGGKNPLGGGGLPDDFYSTDARTVTVDGQEYAVGYGEGAIDPGFANAIESKNAKDKAEALENATLLTDITNTLKSGLGQSVADKLQGIGELIDTYGKTSQINQAKQNIRSSNPDLSDDEVNAKAIAQVIESSKTNLLGPGYDDLAFNSGSVSDLLNPVVDDLRTWSDESSSLISEETQKAMDDSAFVGDFSLSDLGSFLETRGDASAKGILFNALTEIPDIATDIGTYMLTGLAGTAVIGGAEGAGAAANDVNAMIDGMLNAGELQKTQQYQIALEAANGDAALAVEVIKQSTLQSTLAGVAAAAGLGDAVLAGLVTKNPLLEKMTDNFVGKITTGALSEGLTEGTEQFITNYGLINQSGADIVGLNYGTGVAGAATQGATVGAGVGTTAAFVDVLTELANSGTSSVSELVANNVDGTSVVQVASENLLNQTNDTDDTFTVTANTDGTYTVVNENTGESQVVSGADLTTVTENASPIQTAVEYDGDAKTLTNTKTGLTVKLDSDTPFTNDIAEAVANGEVPAGVTLVQEASSDFTSTTDTEGTRTTETGGTVTKRQVGVGGTDVVTHGDVTVTTLVNQDGNTVVTTTNNVTGETTSDIVANGTSTIITNGDTAVNVDATTATVTGTTVTAGATTDVATEVNTDSNIATDTATNTATTTTIATTTDDSEQPGVETTTTTVPGGPVAVSGDDDEPKAIAETTPGYTSGIANTGRGIRPVVAPRYQDRSTGIYTAYRPEPGVAQTPQAPVFAPPETYLAQTVQNGMRYGNDYILPNADPARLAELAKLQGTGAAKLPAEYLLSDEDVV